MNEPPPEPPKKIIIDEDWKAQVEREKAEAQVRSQGSAASPGLHEVPPASFEFLVSSLVTQTLAALGQFPDPLTQKYEVHLSMAKLHIDLLGVLQDKTKGNLSDNELGMLDDALHQLRMLYVSVRDRPVESTEPRNVGSIG